MTAHLLAALLIAAALAVGTWATLNGAVLASTAGFIDDDAARLDAIRLGVALALVGLFLFLAGAIGAARMLSA